MAYRLPSRLRRRTVLRGLLGAGAYGVSSQFLGACSSGPEQALNTGRPNQATGQPIAVGFIYEGAKDDVGYNQSHAQAVSAIAAWYPEIEVVEEAKVPETTAVQETIRSMIELDGATIIFPTSNGYFDPYVLQLAEEFPNVQFLLPGQHLDEQDPSNLGSYFCHLEEPAYLTGMTAGIMTQNKKLGLVIPKLIPAVRKEINSFVLGARSVNPEVTALAMVTGGWNLPIKEAEAANSLIDQGVDVMFPRCDNAKVIAAIAKHREVFYCGYHINQADLAPQYFLTGIEWNWTTVYKRYAEMFQAGKTLMNGGIPRTIMGGLKENFSTMSPYGFNVSAEIQRRVEDTKEKILGDELIIFTGGIKDNEGTIVIPEGDAYPLDDLRLDVMDWFVEGIETS